MIPTATDTYSPALMTADQPLMSRQSPTPEATEAQHSNGRLVCFTYGDLFYSNNITLVLNPSTHKFFNLPRPPGTGNHVTFNFFGFDESRNEHKVLSVSSHVMVFSLSSYSWIKIDPPVNIIRRHRWYYGCVNSTIHILLRDPQEILAFDLRTDRFSTVEILPGAVPKRIIKINGLLAIVCNHRLEETNEMCIWILQDYEKRVWVRETVRFPNFGINMGRPFMEDSGNTNEIIFSPRVLSEDLIEVPIYDMKSRCFKSIQLTLDHRFLRKKLVELEGISCYVESLIPLQD